MKYNITDNQIKAIEYEDNILAWIDKADSYSVRCVRFIDKKR